MKFGVLYGGAGHWAGPQGARLLARTTERLGFDSLWATDHVVVAANDQDERYREKGGRWEFSSEYPIADPMVWLGYVGAVTSRITLATGVLVAPLRPAAVLAKQAASLDVLTEGRLVLGLGAGWIPEELEACGVRFEDRMAVLEESVVAMRALWSGPSTTFDGRFNTYNKVALSPRPTRGNVPIVLGGRVRAAAERAGRLGDGFFPHTPDPERLRKLFETARRTAEDAGRDPADVELIAGGARTAADLEQMIDIGVDHVILSPRVQDPAALEDALLKYKDDVITPVLGPTWR